MKIQLLRGISGQTLRVSRRIAGGVESLQGCFLEIDMVGVAVPPHGVMGQDHLRMKLTHLPDNFAHQFVQRRIDQRLGVLVIF